MIPKIVISKEDRDIQRKVIDCVHEQNGKVDLLDIANYVSRQCQYIYSRQRIKEWTILLINDGIIQDGPSMMFTIEEEVYAETVKSLNKLVCSE
jgi:hypothetical protein